METTKEKIAYLRGVLDGCDTSLKDERIRFLFEKMLWVLDDLASDIEDLSHAQAELDDYLEEVDFDLAYLEDQVYVCDDDCDCDDDWEELGGDSSLLEVRCNECGDIVAFDEELLFDDGGPIRCPNCNAIVFAEEEFEELEDLLHEDDLANQE